jgi:hypothetical protein
MEKPAEISRRGVFDIVIQLTSAGFSMTISNTLTASTDFSRFFHDYIKHTSSTDFNLLKSVEEVCV